ncbi:MAG: DUF3131 domain-containing protein [Candidatus Omnitrophica bacterium]|nr:DUF3131 domain-containing protein [Candidatus Omnitrophota bacterium]
MISTPLNTSSHGLSSIDILQERSQFEILDDFNHGQIKDSSEIFWKSISPSKISLQIDKDSRRQEAGHSLKSRYQLAKAEKALLKYQFNRLDISLARSLIFILRHQPEKENNALRVTLGLEDQQGGKATSDISLLLPSRGQEWKKINIPISEFQGVNLDRLQSLSFEFENRGSFPQAGDFWLDEIAFYGTENLGFESMRDNFLGFPQNVYAPERKAELWAKLEDKELLREIAKDTWRYFENSVERNTFLISDHVLTGKSPLIASYTSATNIAMDMLATVSARDLGFIDHSQAVQRLQKIFKTLSKMRRYKYFFYNFYDVTSVEPTREFISSVDSGWLAIAMVIARQAFPEELGAEASKFLDEFDFEEFYDHGTNQLSLGTDTQTGRLNENHYGLLATEARATSLLAIGKGDIAREHWWYLFRTPPVSWTWQNQKPRGREVEQEGTRYFQGYYIQGNKKFIPSWGGSLFEFLMPTLVLKEREMAPRGLGLNNKIATELHRDYALKVRQYPVWGISPSGVVNGKGWRYREFGVKSLAAKGYSDAGVITPHVSFLALDSLPQEAIANIRKLLDYEIYGEYGFYDTLDLKAGKVNTLYLALDQGMILAAICNYLKEGSLKERFHRDSAVKRAEDLLMKESFFSS